MQSGMFPGRLRKGAEPVGRSVKLVLLRPLSYLVRNIPLVKNDADMLTGLRLSFVEEENLKVEFCVSIL